MARRREGDGDVSLQQQHQRHYYHHHQEKRRPDDEVDHHRRQEDLYILSPEEDYEIESRGRLQFPVFPRSHRQVSRS